MINSGVAHFFVPLAFISRMGCNVGRLAHPLVVNVVDNRNILVIDVYRGLSFFLSCDRYRKFLSVLFKIN